MSAPPLAAAVTKYPCGRAMQTSPLASPLPLPRFRSCVSPCLCRTVCVHTFTSCTGGMFTRAPILKERFGPPPPKKKYLYVSFLNTHNISRNRSTEAEISSLTSPTSIPPKAKNPLQALCSALAGGKSPSMCKRCAVVHNFSRMRKTPAL